MASWLKRKGQDSRVYMCMKELRWNLEQSSELRRAEILAMSALLRASVLSELRGPDALFDRPLDFSRDLLMEIYEVLEEVRNANVAEFENLQKNMHRVGTSLPQFALEHASIARRALEVWMITIGAGILPQRRDEARQVWALLGDALRLIEDAFESIRETERRTADATGQDTPGLSSILTPDQWRELCSFVPSQLSAS